MDVRQVRVRVLWPVLGFTPGQELTLARTELIAALLERGYLVLVDEPTTDGATEPAPADTPMPPATAGEPPPRRAGRSR